MDHRRSDEKSNNQSHNATSHVLYITSNRPNCQRCQASEDDTKKTSKHFHRRTPTCGQYSLGRNTPPKDHHKHWNVSFKWETFLFSVYTVLTSPFGTISLKLRISRIRPPNLSLTETTSFKSKSILEPSYAILRSLPAFPTIQFTTYTPWFTHFSFLNH